MIFLYSCFVFLIVGFVYCNVFVVEYSDVENFLGELFWNYLIDIKLS